MVIEKPVEDRDSSVWEIFNRSHRETGVGNLLPPNRGIFVMKKRIVQGVMFLGVYALLLIIFNWAKNFYLTGNKKPFWKGTEVIQVCKMPYDSSEDCTKESVILLDRNNALIKFKDEDVAVSDFDCKFTYISIPNQPRFVFCRTWDKNKQQWDLLPIWAYTPSVNDFNKMMKKYVIEVDE